MGLTVQHVKTLTQPDSTNPDIVRPADWNSGHVVQFSQDVVLGGNTAGIAALAADKLYLHGGNNITLSGNGGTVTVVGAAGGAGGGVALSAGTQSQSSGTVLFANGNGVTFGLDNGTLTGSVRTDYLTTAQPVGAYLTTAAQSDHSHNFATTTTNGSQIVVGTANSAGATIGVPPFLTTAQPVGAYLTTAAQSDHSHGNPTLALTNLTGTTASNSAGFTLSLSAANPGGGAGDGYNIIGVNGGATQLSTTYQLSNANNVSFGLNAGTITASASYPAQTVQPAVAQLNGSSGTMSLAVGSSLSASSNGSTITFGLASNITTALQSAGAYLTTAMQSGASANFAATGFTTTTAAGAVISGTHDTAGLKLAVPSYLTTARASNDAIGLNSGLTANGVSMTANSSGLSLNFPAFLTTAAQSGHTHGNPTLNLTNINGTTASASNGLTLSLSAVVPAQTNQTANFYVSGNTTQLSSTAAIDLRSVSFEGAGIASVGVSNGRVMVSVPAGGGGGDGYNIVGIRTDSGNTAGATWSSLSASVYLEGGNNITLSQNSNTIVISGGGGGAAAATATMWFPFNEAVNVVGQQGQGTLHIVPVPTPGNIGGDGIVSVDRLALPIIVSASSNSTGSATISHWFGLYQRENTTGTRISLIHSTSGTIGVTYSGSVNTTAYSGIRLFTIPWTSSFSDGRYYVANVSRTTTANTNCTISQLLVSNLNSNFSGLLNVASNASYQWPLGWGVYSATTSALPATIAFSQIQGTGSLAMRNPEWFMVNGTA